MNSEIQYDADKDELLLNTTLKDYACNVMKKSLVTGVTNIVETKFVFKRIFKIVALVFCICLFFYQSILFVRHAMTYPSVVDIQMYVPETYVKPAYTFCNNNGIKRTKYCAKYPKHCETLNATEAKNYCEYYKRFCASLPNKENITIVKDEFRYVENEISFEELKELGHTHKSLEGFDETPPLFDDEDDDDEDDDDVDLDKIRSGPFMTRKQDGTLVLCYSYNLLIDSSEWPKLVPKPERQFGRGVEEFSFEVESSEVFIPEREAGILFALHTPFTLLNPLINGVFLKPKRSFFLHFRLKEEELLPYPYKSDCFNYTQNWIDNGYKGPRSQEACLEKCEMEFCLKDCNCTFPEVFYPPSGPYCSFRYMFCLEEDDEIRIRAEKEDEECKKQCKNDCHRFIFEHQTQMRYREIIPKALIDALNVTDEDVTDVKIFLDSDPEVVRYQYRAQYETLDILSSLGGFVGAWLGISLVAIIDLVESLGAILLFYCRKRKAMRLKRSKNPDNFNMV